MRSIVIAIVCSLFTTVNLCAQEKDESGSFIERFQFLFDVIKTNPRDYLDYINRGLVWEMLKEHDKAINDYSKAIELDPKNVDAFKFRGHSFRKKGDYDKAIADFTIVLKAKPNDALAIGSRALAWFYKREYDKSLNDLELALRLHPEDHSSYGLRALIWIQYREYDKALADFNKAVKFDPDFGGDLAWFLATCPDKKFRNGKKALILAQKACELTKWEVAGFLGSLSAAYAENGDFKNAIKWVKKAMELEPKGVHAETREKMLAAFEKGKPYRDHPKEKR